MAPFAADKYSTRPLEFQPFDQVQAGEGKRDEPQSSASSPFCCAWFIDGIWHQPQTNVRNNGREREGEAGVSEGCELGQTWETIQAFITRKEQQTCRAADQTSALCIFPTFGVPFFFLARRNQFRPIGPFSEGIWKGSCSWRSDILFRGDAAAWTGGSPLINLSSGEPPPCIRASLMQLLALGVLPTIRSTPLARLSSRWKWVSRSAVDYQWRAGREGWGEERRRLMDWQTQWERKSEGVRGIV